MWPAREFIFRKYSCILYFPVAVIIQMITMVTNFCLIATNKKSCDTGYAISLIILLAVHQVIDVVLFLIVKKQYEQHATDHPNGEI